MSSDSAFAHSIGQTSSQAKHHQHDRRAKHGESQMTDGPSDAATGMASTGSACPLASSERSRRVARMAYAAATSPKISSASVKKPSPGPTVLTHVDEQVHHLGIGVS